MKFNNFDEIVEFSTTFEGDCQFFDLDDLEIEIDGHLKKCYEATISYREVTLTFEDGYAQYDINNIYGENSALLNEYVLD